ncbi:MAG TPA: hypothetical protein VL490_00210 [Mucilaginibacter sp.]|jgi:hypothetical protein|nr:hypothetical protein [Mucilaginibacter sp.]
MNNSFSIKRFTLLFKKHSIEHAKTYLLSTTVLAGIIAVLLGFFSYSNDGRLPVQAQAVLFIYTIAGAGGIFASLSFADLGNKRKATQVLTLPASHFEKYLVAWIYSFIIYLLVFLGVFYIVDWTVIELSTPPPNIKNTLLDITNFDQPAWIGFVVFALLHGFAIWGSVFFEKMHFIKTAFVFFLYMIALLLINEPLIHVVIGKKYIHGAAFGPLYFMENNQHWRIQSTAAMDIFSISVLFGIVVLFWITAFFRLKEKEI